MLFGATVRTTLLSGLTAWALNAQQIRRLEVQQVKFLRAMFRGRAQGLTNQRVRGQSKIFAAASTLKTWRLQWLQRIFSDPPPPHYAHLRGPRRGRAAGRSPQKLRESLVQDVVGGSPGTCPLLPEFVYCPKSWMEPCMDIRRVPSNAMRASVILCRPQGESTETLLEGKHKTAGAI